MNRRDFIRTAGLSALALSLRHDTDAAAETGKAAKPNIILILADDLGYGDVGCYNSEAKVPTPNLDKLARQGMRFTDVHSPSAICTPSRYGVLTGRMAFRTGYGSVFEGVGGPCLIEDGRLTLPQMLRDQGYTTACVGKWHIGMTFLDKNGQPVKRQPGSSGVEAVKRVDFSRAIPDGPVSRGFDSFYGTACCPGTDYLYAYIENDRVPVPPTRMLDKTSLPKHAYSHDNREGLIAPDYNLEEVDMVFLDKSRKFLESHVKANPDKPFFLYHATAAVHLPSFAGKDFKGRTKAGPHGDYILEFDFIVGELMKTLERLGVLDNTLIMVSSDNGPEVTAVIHMREDYRHDGARPWRGVKRDQWEGGHRVPFIASWPDRIKAGGTSDQTMSLTDIMATCGSLTGARLPDNAGEDSFDMSPALLGSQGNGQIREFTLQQSTGKSLSIRSGKWKYIDHKGSGGNNYNRADGELGDLRKYVIAETAPDAPGQLYDLESDPGETVNLYFRNPEITARLKSKLEDFKRSGRTRT